MKTLTNPVTKTVYVLLQDENMKGTLKSLKDYDEGKKSLSTEALEKLLPDVKIKKQ